MRRVKLSLFTLPLVYLLGLIASVLGIFNTNVYATHLYPECDPHQIRSLEPTATGLIDPDHCPPIKTCYVKYPAGDDLTGAGQNLYSCYSVIIELPSLTPSPAAPRTPGAVDFPTIEQALPEFKFTNSSVSDIFNDIIPYLFGIAGLILLLYLIWGGFGLMVSRGDPKAVEAAKEKITSALIGFVIIFVAFWLVQLLGLIFGISQFESVFGK